MLWMLAACAPPDPVDAAPTSGSFSVLTYNVQGLPDVLTDNGRPTAERMERISPFLDGFDVAGLQEDFDATHHALLLAVASHPIQEWFDATVDTTRVYGAGLTVLARIGTPVAVFEEHYTDCNGVLDGASDCLASKGFQVVRLDLGGGAELDVYNTHHEAGGGPVDDAVRGAQVAQVVASMDGRSAGRAVLFMGDTNLRWSDPEDVDDLMAYQDAGLRDACDEVDCPEDDHIDRFLLRDSDALTLQVEAWRRAVELVDEDGADLSDHPGISTEIHWAR